MLTREQLSRNLGTNLERERFKLGYSQQDMAKALDMSMPLSQLFEVLFDSSVVVKYPIF